MLETLLASSFITEADLRPRVQRSQGGEPDVEQRLTRACNRAIAWLEKRTVRRLRARNYRTAVTAATVGSTAADAVSITITSTAALKVGDDVTGHVGLSAGTQVQSITDGTQFVPSKKVLSTIPTATVLSFADKPLQIDVAPDLERGYGPWGTAMRGAVQVWCPESPLLRANLYAIYWLDGAGARTALDLTGARLDEAVGQIVLSSDVAPAGAQVLQLECRAGYEQPSGLAVGHPEDWMALSAIQLRVAEIYFSDDQLVRGRASNIQVGDMSMSAPSMRMPEDVEQALEPYVRLTP